MEKVKNNIKKLWNLAVANKKVTAVVIAAIIVLIYLQK